LDATEEIIAARCRYNLLRKIAVQLCLVFNSPLNTLLKHIRSPAPVWASYNNHACLGSSSDSRGYSPELRLPAKQPVPGPGQKNIRVVFPETTRLILTPENDPILIKH